MSSAVLTPVKSGKSSGKSDPTDTYSEASSASPRAETAEDLSIKTKTEPQGWSESEGLEAKCSQCGCLFDTPDMLKIHVQETHMFPGGGDPAHFLSNHHQQKESLINGVSPDKNGTIFDPEAYCELCNKEFCNKYYLASHRASKHGEGDTPRSGSFSQLPNTSPGGFQSEMLAEKCTLPTIPGSEENRCPYCAQNVESAAALQSHVLNVHCPPPNMQSLQALYAAQLMGQGGVPSPFSHLLGQDKLKMLPDNQPTQVGTMSPSVLALMSEGGLGALLSQGKTEDMEAYLNALQQQSLHSDLPPNFLPLPASPGQGPANNGGVVNPEAYCELCRKEFCNKYFLRTHKAKKHGIVVEDSPGSLKRRLASLSSASPDHLPRHDFHHTSVIQSLFDKEPPLKRQELDRNDATPPATTKPDSFRCNLCPAAFPAYINLITHQYQEHGELGMGTAANGSVTNTGSVSSSATATTRDPETFCELCQKEFCSKYFLRQHKANIHGVHTPDTATPPSAALSLSPNKRMTPSFNFPPHSLSLFGKEPSPLFTSSMPTMVPSSHMPSSHMPTTPNSANKPRYSTGKNFCDICNKEVCNKYFLRTHMLKMHGIVIDEHKTVIGNINTLDKEKTGTLIFRCDICSKEMRSREQLRAHKQETHGVLPRSVPTLPPPQLQQHQHQQHQQPQQAPQQHKPLLSGQLSNSSSSGSDQYRPLNAAKPDAVLLCPFCETKAPSTKHLQAHILKECPHRALFATGATHPARKEPSEHSSPSLSQTSDLSSANDAAETAPSKCDFCEERFPDLMARQLHVLATHALQIRALAEAAFRKPASANSDSDDRSSNSVDRHSTERSISGDRSKPYACNVCARAYRQPQALQRHKQGHRLAAAATALVSKYHSPSKDEHAKRFRCTACEKVFKSREQCRTHLFAAHRRQLDLSPLKTADKTITLDREVGWGEPALGNGRPHIVQMFRVESGDERFGRLNLFLPVPAPLDGPLSLNLTLTPLLPHESRIKAL